MKRVWWTALQAKAKFSVEIDTRVLQNLDLSNTTEDDRRSISPVALETLHHVLRFIVVKDQNKGMHCLKYHSQNLGGPLVAFTPYT
jgi:hypothetical protein